jgi:predicted nucleic acid-binding protein
MRSAFARLIRMGQLTATELSQAQDELEDFKQSWREIEPGYRLREQAEGLVDRFPLKAADALQLAAAMTWCAGHPRNRPFISGDGQLLNAAHQLGFRTISV